jgi:type II secretory pathway component PulC
MSRVLFLVAASLFALPARAAPPQEPTPPRATPRATLVEVLRGGKQVLVLDRATGDYAVMKVGDSIQGFRITAIEDDQIVLSGSGKPERHFVIPLLDRTPLPPMKTAPAAAPAAGQPVDPYATTLAPPAPAEGVLDPYGPAEVPVAPENSRAATPTTDATTGADSKAPASPTTSAPAAAPAPTPAPPATEAAPPPAAKPAPGATPAPAKAPRTDKRRLSRKDLNKALSDFAALSREIKIERAAGGGILVTDLARGSFAARVGIEKGDIVRRVAGHAIDTVDDAAAAYAAVVAARQVVVEIDRHGARIHITYQLTD